MANLHGTGLVLGGIGVMLRGRSGAGKSLLALQLLDAWRDRGLEAFLVADDRLDIEVRRGRLVMTAPPNIAGLIELRGRGIVRRPMKEKANLDLIVDMTEELIRFHEDEALAIELEGVRVAHCPVPERGVVDSAHQMLLVSEAIAQCAAGKKSRRRAPAKK